MFFSEWFGRRARSGDGARVTVQRGDRKFEISPQEIGVFKFQSGDEISAKSPAFSPAVHRTPDQSFHFAVGEKRYRLPLKYVLTDYKGMQIPEHLIVLTGAGSETLELFGRLHLVSYDKFLGLSPDMTILELGCGIGRDALQFMERISDKGRYIGVDVTWESIEWCRKNITSVRKNFQFFHFDAQHELYNPLGKETSLSFRLPVEDASVDRVCAGSVFTHLFEDEIVHYMSEIRRVLKPGGLAYATFFHYSDEIIAAARRTNVTPNNLMFHHAYADGCYVNDPGYPTGAVAFTDKAMTRMIAKAGLVLDRPYLPGAWSGAFTEPADGQDVAILRRA